MYRADPTTLTRLAGMPPFTFADVERMRGESPRRRQFAESSSDLNPNGSFTLGFKFRFVAELFEHETDLRTRTGPYGPWANFTDTDEIQLAREWKSRRDRLVFLHDNLDYSIALDFNFAAEGEYTPLGLAEHRAKEEQHAASLDVLCGALLAAIGDLPAYQAANALCAVPPSQGKTWDLPTEIVKRIAPVCGKQDLSNAVAFTNKKQSLKALSLEDKWASLEASGFQADPKSVKEATIILIDDKYQSGTTAQFVACKLYEAGAKSVMGLYCVKTWRDTDNT